MHLLLHLHQAVIVLLKLLVFRETLLVLHSHQVQGVDAGGEMTAPQDSLVVRDQGGVVRGERSRLQAFVLVQVHVHHVHSCRG